MPTTACLLVIGNEILSGRTQDANIRFLATGLGELGIALEEVRVIPDRPARIVNTVTECRARFDHVFTTGGIGPTHDDITAACVAEAVGVPLEIHPESYRLLEDYLGKEKFNPARQRMAMLPRGATPIPNSVSVAPGFTIANVHVMAGIPRVMQAMFTALAPTLEHGAPLVSVGWHAIDLREGALAEGLTAIQAAFPALDLGSYPFERPDGRRGVTLVAKGYDAGSVAAAGTQLHDFIVELGHTPIEGEPVA
ncbi:competence-damage protein [Neoasaia chiangmaiensis NBRC 101099]|uniref:Molybdopterin-binding protein n=1 Tax=Neoasaia chiangmaiensis TaxID=320497 RepID=A0A1U9KRF9_9PROT|nr:molybdopterin-binding protein [Neoasaia chiangmaiensis]AQS88337.1 molybdopterin-binding protein [Neoasaia chiangmaiensis]GBR39503.1 competence-damage protein [Neoasaia chiangmaiensis NBRC 101099]GEN14612.1 molybdenum cofactor biosynthesis protein [Neoasaia chiangmaiensis]